MAQDSADETLSSDELREAFDADPEPIQDELLAIDADLPLVEPVPEPRARPAAPADARGLSRALWFFGLVVTALLVLQSAMILLPRFAAHDATPVAASSPPPQHATPVTAPAEEIDAILRAMKSRLSHSLYLDVIRTLEPKAEDPMLFDKDQRFEAAVLLAKAYRALGNVEQAQKWQLRATDQMIERREPAQVIEYAGTLAGQGRHAEARVELMKLLARRDGLVKREEQYLSLAEERVADAWYAQAQQSKQLAPLPGASRAPGASHATERQR